MLGRGNYPFGHYRKSSMTVSYQDGDDFYYQAGWLPGLTIAQNIPRFQEFTVGSDKVAIDKITGIMWPIDGNQNGWITDSSKTWTQAVTWAEALTFAGHSDWRMPNIIELMSIYDLSSYASAPPSPFENTPGGGRIWTSTSSAGSYAYYFTWPFEVGSMHKDSELACCAIRLGGVMKKGS